MGRPQCGFRDQVWNKKDYIQEISATLQTPAQE